MIGSIEINKCKKYLEIKPFRSYFIMDQITWKRQKFCSDIVIYNNSQVHMWKEFEAVLLLELLV